MQPGERTLYYFLSIPATDEFLPIKRLINASLKQPGIAPIATTMQKTLDGISFENESGKKIEFEQGLVIGSVVQAIKRSDFIIADLTGLNPNVLYEVGFAHALRKPVLLMIQPENSRIPSDISGNRFFIYELSVVKDDVISEFLKDEIQQWVTNLKQSLFTESGKSDKND